MRIDMMHPADQLVSIMNRIYSTGQTTMSGGNLSIQEPNGDLWVTPGGVDKGMLTRSDIVCIHADGSQEGYLKPTSELFIHQTIHDSCADIQAILHAHSPALATFSVMNRVPTVNLIPNTRLVCDKIGQIEYVKAGSPELGAALASQIRKGCSVILMDNHGVCIVADTISKAYMIFETLEYAARTELLALRIGQPNALTDEQVDIARTEAHIRLSEFTPRQHSSEERALRRDMTRMIHRALEQHLFSSTQGTISSRLSDGSFLITPFAHDRWQIHEEHLVLVRRSMKEAGKTPSRAVFLNELIYHHRPDIQTIICAQPPNLMAFTLTDANINTRIMMESYTLLKNLPRVPYGINYTDPKRIMRMFSEDTPAVLLDNDGIIVTGQSLHQAFDCFEVAEFTASTQLAVPSMLDLKTIY